MNSDNAKWLVFFLVATGVFLATMDSSMVNIALPSIMAEFHSPLAHTEGVVLIYLLTTSATMLFWGHVSHRLGRENIYISGLVIFALGSFLCSRAGSLPLMILFRFVQALGAAMMMANGPAMLKTAFGSDQLGRSLGLIGIATSLGLMTGPVLGGFLIEYSSWRSLFLFPAPICITAGLLAKIFLRSHQKDITYHPFDWQGAFWWICLLISCSYVLSHAAAPKTSASFLAGGLTICLTSLFFFVRREGMLSNLAPTDHEQPAAIIPAVIFRKKSLLIAVATAAMIFLCLFSVLILTPFYLDRVLGLPASKIGLIMLAIPITALITAPIAGWLADFTDVRIVATSGLIICTFGLYSFTTLSITSNPWPIAGRLGFFGVGLSLFLSPNSASALRNIGEPYIGTVSALLATARTLGMLLGIALASLSFALFFSHLSGGLDMKDYNPQHAQSFIEALHRSYFCFLGVGIGAVLISALRPAAKNGMERGEAAH
ncbi:MAG: MFS transporter [Thermodesulfobacteriota bacterium]